MIPFSPPRIDQAVIDEVVHTLRSGWITTGPKTKQFEKNLSAFTGAPATLCLNSATAGLELMLRWFGVREGDEVICPSNNPMRRLKKGMKSSSRPIPIQPQPMSLCIAGPSPSL